MRDSIADDIELAMDFVIGETDNAKAFLLQKAGAVFIVSNGPV
ncbi:MAG TPA: hypothetical protein VHY57_08920 [Rhizomicrobium sp.]|nr:hypothetical protein [Rhizomicrobium sp.]